MRCPKCKLVVAEYLRLCPECQTDLRNLNELFGPFYEPHPEAFLGLFEEGLQVEEGLEEDFLFVEEPEPQEEMPLQTLGEEELPLEEEAPELDLSDLDLPEEPEGESLLEAEEEAPEGEIVLEELEEEPLEEIHEELLEGLEEIEDLLPGEPEKEAT